LIVAGGFLGAGKTTPLNVQTAPNDLEDLIFWVFDKSLDWQGEHTIIS
jgi:G3E family GTPase